MSKETDGRRRLVRIVLAFIVGAFAAIGLTFGVQAAAQGSATTYYACLKGGKLSSVGAIPPNCKAPATQITLGANGANVITSPATPYGSCNSGDTDIALSSDEVWSCLAGNWTDTDSNIKGATGPQGPQGETGPQGSTGATGATPPVPVTYQWNPTVGGTQSNNYVIGNTTFPVGSTLTVLSGSLTAPFENCPSGIGGAYLALSTNQGGTIADWDPSTSGNVSELAPTSTSSVTLASASALVVESECNGNSAPVDSSSSFKLTFTVSPPAIPYS